MSNYGRDKALGELWAEILRRHWDYLEQEDNYEKIVRRKKLEGVLREYLSIVPHDRKFTASTGHVLRQSVNCLKDFSANDAAMGFESISQYANNLFIKPWRKEYRVIKMYSGFFEHEIRANLVDAEQLFVAMGYKLMSNQTLVLDGAICPDQVTNVSRDAMAAYIECQIMKQVNLELFNNQLPTSWQEIFNFREGYVGDSSSAFKGIANNIQNRHSRKSLNDNCYPPMPAPPQSHNYNMYSNGGPPCSVHPHNQYYSQPAGYGNQCSMHPMYGGQPQNHYYPHPSSAMNMNNMQNMNNMGNMQNMQNMQTLTYSTINHTQPPPVSLPHSKSLDQYENNIQVMQQQLMHQAHHHRHSLDQSMDNRHNSHLQPAPSSFADCVDSGSCTLNAFKNDPYNVPNNRYPIPFDISTKLAGANGMNGGANYHEGDPMQFYPMYDNPYYNQSTHSSHNTHNNTSNSKQAELISFDTKSKEPQKLKSSLVHRKEVDLLGEYERNYLNGGLVNNSTTAKKPYYQRTVSDSFDSLEDEMPSKSKSSTTNHDLAQQNKDGFGSYGQWNFVYKNLEQQGYNKDLGERGDIVMEDKMREISIREQERADRAEEKAFRMNNAVPKETPPPPSHYQTPRPVLEEAAYRASKSSSMKEALPAPVIRKSDAARISMNSMNLPSDTKMRNGVIPKTTKSNGLPAHSDKGTAKRDSSKPKSSSHDAAPPAEWNCKHCTFLNTPDVKICEICSKSRDFFLDSDKVGKSSTTCV